MKALEEQTANLPTDWFMWAAAFSLLASATLVAAERRDRRLVFGHWTPALLLFGGYNKLVMQLVSQQTRHPSQSDRRP